MKKDLGHMRENYASKQLDENMIDVDPTVQFSHWFDEAKESEIVEPNAMILSTATVDGVPSSRTVLLKEFGESGFVFYTNYTSQKGNELESNPIGSLLFLWKELERQVRISGSVKRGSREKSEVYFNTRPKASRIGAIVSNQSSVISNRLELEEKKKELETLYKHSEDIPCPENWGAYILQPLKFEFWQGRPSRLHDRIQYQKRNNANWKVCRLAP